MKVHLIVQRFREEYEEPGVVEGFLDLEKAEKALEEWEKDNEDNCEESRFIQTIEMKDYH